MVPCYTLQLRCHLAQVITERNIQHVYYDIKNLKVYEQLQQSYENKGKVIYNLHLIFYSLLFGYFFGGEKTLKLIITDKIYCEFLMSVLFPFT